ncbi:hypothetical protein GCM10023184_13440 [Flaviaesturariibacter amylovorans]|uniref:DUF4136 domain-containing protein n=2 Tax=Flaviaesturariibacter amylovorans TaxID=1084520 RepID=A0ABP8GK35_9BACT
MVGTVQLDADSLVMVTYQRYGSLDTPKWNVDIAQGLIIDRAGRSFIIDMPEFGLASEPDTVYRNSVPDPAMETINRFIRDSARPVGDLTGDLDLAYDGYSTLIYTKGAAGQQLVRFYSSRVPDDIKSFYSGLGGIVRRRGEVVTGEQADSVQGELKRVIDLLPAGPPPVMDTTPFIPPRIKRGSR